MAKKRAEYMRAYRKTESGGLAVARAQKRCYEKHREARTIMAKLHVYDAILKSKYGITREQYDALLASQGGKCAACGNNVVGNKSKMMCVDHDHKTGRVRGLLCRSCNLAAGSLKDDPERAILLAEYLRRVQ